MQPHAPVFRRASVSFQALVADELSFEAGDIVEIFESGCLCDDGWLLGRLLASEDTDRGFAGCEKPFGLVPACLFPAQASPPPFGPLSAPCGSDIGWMLAAAAKAAAHLQKGWVGWRRRRRRQVAEQPWVNATQESLDPVALLRAEKARLAVRQRICSARGMDMHGMDLDEVLRSMPADDMQPPTLPPLLEARLRARRLPPLPPLTPLLPSLSPSTEVLNEYVCPITAEVMTDPVCTSGGFTYERTAIEKWLRTKDTSPSTGAKLESKKLIPNIMARSLIHRAFDGSAVPACERMEVATVAVALRTVTPSTAARRLQAALRGWLVRSGAERRRWHRVEPQWLREAAVLLAADGGYADAAEVDSAAGADIIFCRYRSLHKESIDLFDTDRPVFNAQGAKNLLRPSLQSPAARSSHERELPRCHRGPILCLRLPAALKTCEVQELQREVGL